MRLTTKIISIAASWYDFLQESAASGLLENAIRCAILRGLNHPSLTEITSRLATSDFQDVPKIELLPGTSMQDAMGAYAASTSTIYINADWLATVPAEVALRVLTEEFGHHLDSLLNTSDTGGDEGEVLAALLFDGPISDADAQRMASQDDTIFIVTNGGRILSAEAANINGGEGNDVLIGTKFDDLILGRGGDDRIDGGAGDDRLETGQGNDNSYGRDGNDEIWVGNHNDRKETRHYVDAGAGDDFVALFANITGDSFIYGGSGEDIINTTANSSDLAKRDSLISGFERWDDGSGRWIRFIDQNFVGTTDRLITVYYDGTGTGGYETWSGGAPTPLDELTPVENMVDASAVTSGRVRVVLLAGDNYGAFRGGAGNDTLVGSAGGDFFEGSKGNDRFEGGDGLDTAIFLGNRSNYVITELYYNTFTVRDLRGIDGTDTLIDVNALRFADGDVPIVIRGLTIIGDSTDEQFRGGQHADHLDGAGGNDNLGGGAGNDLVDGGTGNDSLSGQIGNDFLIGGEGDDWLYGQDGNDDIDAGAGNDFIVGGDGRGNDIYRGGSGIDTVTYTSSSNSAVLVDLVKGTASGDEIGQDKLSGVENVLGGGRGDRITGSTASNSLKGMGGNDTLVGGSGNDTLFGGVGNDSLDGGLGVDQLVGGAGNDTYILANAGDTIVEAAGAGADTVRAAFSYTLGTNLEHLILAGTRNSAGIGNAFANRITGNAGNNTLNGGLGKDLLSGGAGNDTYVVDNAGDQVSEMLNAGRDGIQSSVSWALGANIESLTLTGSSHLNGTGNTLANTLVGSLGNNVLNGAGGNDTLNGRDGNDRLIGGIGNDILNGGAGADRIVGSQGADRMSGSLGADVFVFQALGDSTSALAGRDTITDFSFGQGDRIDLSAIDARNNLAGDQAFNFIGSGAFTGKAGELSARSVAGGTLIMADVNGDRAADFAVLLDDPITLNANCFLL